MFLLVFCIILVLSLIECVRGQKAVSSVIPQSFRDIPGITSEEIAAIEALKSQKKSFSYGMLHSAYTFALPDGELAGYAPLFCELLSDLFEFPFIPEMYNWIDLKNNLDAQIIDFTGTVNATSDLNFPYFKTSPIAGNKLSVFVKDGGIEIMSEYDLRGLKVGFFTGSSTEQITKKAFPRVAFQSVEINTQEEMAEKLLSGEIDAFIFDSPEIFAFYEHAHVTKVTTFPSVYVPVSISTANPDLEPVISAITKYLMAGGISQFNRLYEMGEREYASRMFLQLLNDEEREYINTLTANKKKVPVGASAARYPVAFYDEESKEFQGIALDVLAEISKLTGIEFQIVNDRSTVWSALENMLKDGEIALLSQLIQNDARREYAIWPDTHYFTARYAFLSNIDFPFLTIDQVPYANVGTGRGTTSEAMYRRWFPDDTGYKTYNGSDEGLDALERGEIDLYLTLDYTLLYESNYRENAGQKVNILFDSPVEEVLFGLNKNEVILCSIISKAQRIINTERIVRNWTNSIFDVSKQMAEQRTHNLITVVASLFILLGVLSLFFIRNLVLTKRVKEANQLKTLFLTTMSHEIRTPMNAILGIAEIQLRNESIQVELQEAFEQIYESGNLLLHIINDILDLSKIDAGRLEIVPIKYDIPSLINDTIQIIIMRYESKPIEFSLKIDENTPLVLIGDEFRIKQVLNNILSNAFKYTNEGSVELSIFPEPSHNKDEVILAIRVSDTGQGLKEDQLKRLFDEYVRFNMETNRGITGTGLGMSITKRLVDLMKGSISVESEPNKGSVFTVRIPQKVSGETVCGAELAEKIRNYKYKSHSITKRIHVIRQNMSHGSVLIVDDVASNLYVAKGLLLPYGLKIDTAQSGFEAIEKIDMGNVYDLIFMDHMMPKMDGIETANVLRGKGYKKPIIALTANAIVGQAEMFMLNGFDGFISKPIDSRELDHLLNHYLRINEPIKEEKPAASNADPELVKAVLMDLENALNMLENFNYKDIETYDTVVHGMKTAFANIKEMELSAFALKLEKMAGNNDIDGIKRETPVFIGALKDMIKKWSSMAGSNSS